MFHISDPRDIKEGKITDVYFDRTVRILKEKNLDKRVVAEVRAHNLPLNYEWAVLSGVDEAVYLLEGLRVNVQSMREGTIFHPEEPVLNIEGNYSEFAKCETPLLGLLCQASGVATRAARCKKASGGKPIYHFGVRRMHPGITSMIDRSSFIGGCDGVAVGKSAEMLGEEPVGTIPHALILLTGDTLKATRFFHEVIEPKVKRVALIDTLGDEKFEALRVAKDMGDNLFAVRLDTPPSRRGDFLELLKEVRWELDLRRFDKVKLFVSGGVDEEKIRLLTPVADAFGVGTWISNAPVVDFSLDIVEIEGRPLAKKGKLSGEKQVWQCPSCSSTHILPVGKRIERCACGDKFIPLLEPVIEEGKLIKALPSPQEIRNYVLRELNKIS
ncbi:MAG: nicotinate phosphoribosyltransferase [Candidatus Aerophobetes bacterium]|nr:nicotinate phosphoribosyltransferase [Candidatus Aerophobetes bacterium]